MIVIYVVNHQVVASTHIPHDETSERNKNFENFIQFCKRSLLDSRQFPPDRARDMNKKISI